MSGEAYTFSERAPERSSVLGRCDSIEGSSEQAVTDLPLTLEHVQAWDNECRWKSSIRRRCWASSKCAAALVSQVCSWLLQPDVSVTML